MPDTLDRFLPEFDEGDMRAKLSARSREELINMLVYAYKEKRVIAKMADEESKRLEDIRKILDQPSRLAQSLGVPTAEDLDRMSE